MRKLLEEAIEVNNKDIQLEDMQTASPYGACVGKIISVEERGHITIDYPRNCFDPLPARSTVNILLEDEGRDVLLLFEKGDPGLPIIIGLIQEQPVTVTQEIDLGREGIRDIISDGEKVTFNANDRIELRCGKSSLIMKSDGKVIIKGTQIISRASEINKVKGAAVQIN